jgi:hypothetical protein
MLTQSQNYIQIFLNDSTKNFETYTSVLKTFLLAIGHVYNHIVHLRRFRWF